MVKKLVWNNSFILFYTLPVFLKITPIITTSETKSSFLNSNQQNLKQFLNLTIYSLNKVKKEISIVKPSTKSILKLKMRFSIMKNPTPQLVSQKKVASPVTSAEILIKKIWNSSKNF
jgi:hypothetical protein